MLQEHNLVLWSKTYFTTKTFETKNKSACLRVVTYLCDVSDAFRENRHTALYAKKKFIQKYTTITLLNVSLLIAWIDSYRSQKEEPYPLPSNPRALMAL